MPTPIEDHGGIVPSGAHPMRLPDSPNKVTLILHSSEPQFNLHFYTSLLMNRITMIYVILPNSTTPFQVPSLHPLIQFISAETSIIDLLKQSLSSENTHIFVHELQMSEPVNPMLWSVLETAVPGSSVQFQGSSGQLQTLWCITNNSVCPPTVSNQSTPARSVQEITATTLSEIVMDVSQSYTPLCQHAVQYMTDKVPYMIQVHRHPYTPVYDTFLRPFQIQQNLKFGEVGVLNGASIRMWRDYFPKAAIHGFDITDDILKNLSQIPGVTGHLIDPKDDHGCVPCLQKATADGVLFDILLEDASHRLTDQLHFLKDAISYVRPGGLLIIEDLFRAIPAARFQEALDCVREKVHNAVLIRPEHTYRFSPGWENDRILMVWVK